MSTALPPLLPAVPSAAPVPPAKTRVIVYIDGLNFFYSVLKGTPHKWLDLPKLFQTLRNRDDVQKVKYFSALISGPGRANQETYLDAAEGNPLLHLTLGRFQDEKFTCYVPGCGHHMRDFYFSKEKQTDVGIGVEMVADAHTDAFDVAVLVSGDSDLIPAVRKAQAAGKKVVASIPFRGPKLGDYARELRGVVDQWGPFPVALLPLCQLPSPANGKSGQVKKPHGW